MCALGVPVCARKAGALVTLRLTVQLGSVAFGLAVVGATSTACSVDVDEASSNDSAVTRVGEFIDVSWSCSANRPDSSGMNSQEEYCEWTRRGRSADGKLQCDFNSNFDATRPFFLTMNESQKTPAGVKTHPETFANSPEFLVGGTERTVDGPRVRKGLVPSCVQNRGVCRSPDCVCGRKSDPQLCAVLGSLARNRCEAEVVATPAKTAAQPTGLQPSKPLVAVQLQIPRSLKDVCSYKDQRNAAGEDVVIPGVKPDEERTYVRCFFDTGKMPNIQSCDDVATSLTVGAKIRPKNCSLAAVKQELDGRTPNACQ